MDQFVPANPRDVERLVGWAAELYRQAGIPFTTGVVRQARPVDPPTRRPVQLTLATAKFDGYQWGPPGTCGYHNGHQWCLHNGH